MKFSEQWLREWVNPKIVTQDLAKQLTMAGLEVDAVTPAAPPFTGVVVGKVTKVEAHPNADKLKVCKVEIGKAKILTIVCGAHNVREGMYVPTACVGAILPGNLIIKQAKLREVTSDGMLCSAKELGLIENAEGLMSLPGDAKPGMDFRKYLQLDDISIELGLTPNRGDCLSLSGIAREVAILNDCKVTPAKYTKIKADIKDKLNIEIQTPEACPRYVGRIIEGVNPAAATPLWMQERLRRSGVRSISAIVDVTNYVMLELGQPMHAFDLAKLNGGIQVRHARQKEKIDLLDGQQVTMTKDTLVIADHKKAVAMAGIMGGQKTAVTDQTESIFLESAFFSPAYIAGKARQYALHTDSSHRFERGVDPELPRKAMERATALLLDIVGGKAGPVTEAIYKKHLPAHKPVKLRADRLQQLLGVNIPRNEIIKILKRLGMEVTTVGQGQWKVISPSHRFDIAIEVDLIEEIARIYGYDRIPNAHPPAQLVINRRAGQTQKEHQFRQLLVDRGYHEAITYSFVDSHLQRLLNPNEEAIVLANPISADMAVMRTNLWPGLLQAAINNYNRQQKRIRLYELGVSFVRRGKKVKEEKIIAGIAMGSLFPEQWGAGNRQIDFYDLKGDVEALLALTGMPGEFVFETGDHPVLHPGQSARIRYQDQHIGNLGMIHPAVTRELGLEGDIMAFELQFSALKKSKLPVFHELSKYPAIRRDIAIIIDDIITSHTVMTCIEETAGDLLQQLQLFDVYKGKGVDSGRKSLALGLTLQDFSRTLNDIEIDTLIERVLLKLNNKLGATLRE